jgi:hypothetical protein
VLHDKPLISSTLAGRAALACGVLASGKKVFYSGVVKIYKNPRPAKAENILLAAALDSALSTN